MRYIASVIWNISEYTGISLGRFAPYVFNIMVDIKPLKLKDKE